MLLRYQIKSEEMGGTRSTCERDKKYFEDLGAEGGTTLQRILRTQLTVHKLDEL
jgi:hypothetical protein